MKSLDKAVEASPLSPNGYEPDGTDFLAHAEHETGFDRQGLARALAFLKQEIDQSTIILGDLAERLSHTLGVLATADEDGSHQSSLSAAAIALQNEDRVQQRLADLSTVLSLLERMLTEGASTTRAELERAIIESFRLEEIRSAFAINAGLIEAFDRSSSQVETPSVGDIDLF